MQQNSKSYFRIFKNLNYPIMCYIIIYYNAGVAYLCANLSFTMIRGTLLMWVVVYLVVEDFIRVSEPLRVVYH